MEQIYLNLIPEVVTLRGFWEGNVVFIDEERLDPKRSICIRNHSQEFSWGYAGSGPSQLALAILLEYLPVSQALAYYQKFKFKFIQTLPCAAFNQQVYLRKIISEL